MRKAALLWTGDPQYEEHLTNLCLSWDNPLLQVVDRAILNREKLKYNQGDDTSLFSPTLENAMYEGIVPSMSRC